MLSGTSSNDDKQPGTAEGGEEWNAVSGILRGLIWGSLTAAVMAVLLGIVAWHAPTLLLHWVIRMAIAFGITTVLFKVIHWAAGMAGSVCTGLAVVLAVAVMLSQHLVFAAHGVPGRGGQLIIGPQWYEPATLLIVNLPALAIIVVCASLCHDGGFVGGTIIEILKSKLH